MKLATTTGDFEHYVESKDVSAALAACADTSFKHIDMSFYNVIYPGSPWIREGDDWKYEIEECLALAGKHGFDFVQAHSPDGVHFEEGEKRDALITATKNTLKACEMLHIPHTVIHAAQIPGATPIEFLKANIDFYKLFAEDAEKTGVDLLTENSAEQNCPGYYLRTGRELAEFVKLAGIPRLYVCWDTGHANMRGNNQYDDVLALGDALHALHVQDNYGDADSHVMPMVGTTNYDQLLRGLTEIGYKGNFTFEGSNTIRPEHSWPNARRLPLESDKLSRVPLAIQQKQIDVMYEIGKWMLETYGVYED